MSIPPPYVIGKVTVKNILVDSLCSSGLLSNFVHKYISKSSNRAVCFYNSNDIKPLSIMEILSKDNSILWCTKELFIDCVVPVSS